MTLRCKSYSVLYEVLLMELGNNSEHEFIKSLTLEEYRIIHDDILTSSDQRLLLDGVLDCVLGLAAPFPITAAPVIKIKTEDSEGGEWAHVLPGGPLFPAASDLMQSLNDCVGSHFEVDQGRDVCFMYDDETACRVRWFDLENFEEAAEKYLRTGGELLVKLNWSDW
jgi:hypothetical protein